MENTQCMLGWRASTRPPFQCIVTLQPRARWSCFRADVFKHRKRNHMMMSWNGNAFRVTGPLWEEFTGHQWIPLTKVSDMGLFYVFFDLRLNKRLSKQSRRQWIETPSRYVLRHCNDDKCILWLPYISQILMIRFGQHSTVYTVELEFEWHQWLDYSTDRMRGISGPWFYVPVLKNTSNMGRYFTRCHCVRLIFITVLIDSSYIYLYICICHTNELLCRPYESALEIISYIRMVWNVIRIR